jgi:hypothetical protein
MTRLRGHFDGKSVVLDEPVPAELRANTPVEILISSERDQALREFEEFSREFWSRALPGGVPAPGRTWRREGLYQRGGRGASRHECAGLCS